MTTVSCNLSNMDPWSSSDVVDVFKAAEELGINIIRVDNFTEGQTKVKELAIWQSSVRGIISYTTIYNRKGSGLAFSMFRFDQPASKFISNILPSVKEDQVKFKIKKESNGQFWGKKDLYNKIVESLKSPEEKIKLLEEFRKKYSNNSTDSAKDSSLESKDSDKKEPTS